MMHNLGLVVGVAALLTASISAVAEPVIDDSPTRVQTTLKTGLEPYGTIRPKSVHEISTSHWALDGAGTDREYADYHRFKEYLPALGIRRLRTQAGWARCEKERGKHDFAWLDSIVFDAQKRGLEVWLETSYGNLLYPGGGGRGLAGGMPSSPEALAAWDRWVEGMARRYKGVVRDWCVWNEPNLHGANDVDTVTRFTLRTAEIIKREIPDARIAACALTHPDLAFIEKFCTALRDCGKANLFTWIAYHHYSYNPDDEYEAVEKMREIVKRLTPNLSLWQNESGVESEWCGSGALSRLPWTELCQAKWDLRRYLADLGRGDDTSVFHAVDLEYRGSGFHDGLVRYGLIKTAGLGENFKVLKVKMSYYAVQNAVSVFNDAVDVVLNHGAQVTGLFRPAIYAFKDRERGFPLWVFWESSAPPTDDNVVVQAVLSVPGPRIDEPVWVDLVTGNVYLVPREVISSAEGVTKYMLPAYDSPTVLTDVKALQVDHAWEVSDYDVRRRANVARQIENVGVYDVGVSEASFASGVALADAGMRPMQMTLQGGRFDLTGFLSAEEVRRARAERHCPERAAYLKVPIQVKKAGTVSFFVSCDYFWRFYANGVPVGEREGGPERQWKEVCVPVKGGLNEILVHTQPGCSGHWSIALRIEDPKSEIVLTVGR